MSIEPLDMQAERFSATGNLASEGMRNQLGRPRLDRLAVLVREAAQNAWDAREDDCPTVTFGLSCFELSAAQLAHIQDVVLAEIPKDGPLTDGQSLGALLQDASERLDAGRPSGLRALAVYDRGTTGLGGPTRADAVDTGSEARDFVDFLRNVGQPPDKSRGGGTFGYGKAALYLSSATSTILVHTCCRNHGRREARFMVSALTDHYESSKGRFTGRHWWGRRDQTDDVVDPLIGSEATRLARKLGLPDFEGTELGTTILLLAPRFGERTPDQAMAYMTAQMLWNFWPKMVPWEGDSEPRMRFEAELDGKRFPVPRPESTPPFDGFLRALQAVRKADASGTTEGIEGVEPIRCKKPKKKLGLLGLKRIVRTEREDIDYGGDVSGAGFLERCHHIALLRRAELVVNYRPGPALPTDFMEYAGVFLADDDMDRIYAGSEPPTHDEWRPENLADRHARTFVRVTLRNIDHAANELVAPADTSHETVEDKPLAAVSAHLGTLLVGAGSANARGWAEVPATSPVYATDGGDESGDDHPSNGSQSVGSRKSRGSGRLPGRPKVELSPEAQLLVEDDHVFRVFGCQVKHGRATEATKLNGRVFPVLGGGGEESDPPVGAERPHISTWRDPAGRVRSREQSVIVGLADEGLWTIWVVGAPHVLVGLDLSAEGLSHANE